MTETKWNTQGWIKTKREVSAAVRDWIEEHDGKVKYEEIMPWLEEKFPDADKLYLDLAYDEALEAYWPLWG
jgi:hypothetical protein